MNLNGLDKEVILSMICGSRQEEANEHTVVSVTSEKLVQQDIDYLSGETTFEMMDELRNRNIDVTQITESIRELWQNENHDAAYLLLVLCYIVSEVNLPSNAIPSLSDADAVEICVYNAYLDMDEYLDAMETVEMAGPDDNPMTET